MNLGLLGFDETVAATARALPAGDAVTLVADVPGEVAATLGATLVAREDLVDARGCDAVVVAAEGWDEARSATVRMLAQSGRPQLVVHPAGMSMLEAYELDMIRADSGAVVVPFLPDRLHPAIERLRSLVARAPERVESILLERHLADRSRREVERAFCRDIDLARVLVGPPTRLSTLGSADETTAWQTLAVGLTAPGMPPVRWQVVRGESPMLVVTVVTADGRSSVTMPDGEPGSDPHVAISWRAPEGSGEMPFDRAATMLGVLQDSIAGTSAAAPIGAATWDDAARTLELAEAIPRSLARGRAVDLHQEEFTELGTFKGTMASLGCGIVLVALVVVVLATLLGGIARQTGWELGERIAGTWPALVLAAMGLFLLLQCLPALVAAPREEAAEGKPGGTGKP